MNSISNVPSFPDADEILELPPVTLTPPAAPPVNPASASEKTVKTVFPNEKTVSPADESVSDAKKTVFPVAKTVSAAEESVLDAPADEDTAARYATAADLYDEPDEEPEIAEEVQQEKEKKKFKQSLAPGDGFIITRLSRFRWLIHVFGALAGIVEAYGIYQWALSHGLVIYGQSAVRFLFALLLVVGMQLFNAFAIYWITVIIGKGWLKTAFYYKWLVGALAPVLLLSVGGSFYAEVLDAERITEYTATQYTTPVTEADYAKDTLWATANEDVKTAERQATAATDGRGQVAQVIDPKYKLQRVKATERADTAVTEATDDLRKAKERRESRVTELQAREQAARTKRDSDISEAGNASRGIFFIFNIIAILAHFGGAMVSVGKELEAKQASRKAKAQKKQKAEQKLAATRSAAAPRPPNTPTYTPQLVINSPAPPTPTYAYQQTLSTWRSPEASVPAIGEPLPLTHSVRTPAPSDYPPVIPSERQRPFPPGFTGTTATRSTLRHLSAEPAGVSRAATQKTVLTAPSGEKTASGAQKTVSPLGGSVADETVKTVKTVFPSAKTVSEPYPDDATDLLRLFRAESIEQVQTADASNTARMYYGRIFSSKGNAARERNRRSYEAIKVFLEARGCTVSENPDRQTVSIVRPDTMRVGEMVATGQLLSEEV